MRLSVMLFPFHTALLDGTLTPRQLVSELAQHGANAIEPMFTLKQKNPELFDEILRQAKEHNLDIACYDIGFNLIGNPQDRQINMEQTLQHIQIAKNMDCKTVLLFGNVKTPEISNEEARKIYAEKLSEATDFAQKLDVTVTIEDFGMTPALACKAQHCKEILELANNRPKMTFDTGNFLYADQMPEQAYNLLKNTIAHVHVKDFQITTDNKPKPCKIGQGTLELKKLVRQIIQDGYDGFFSFEIHGSNLEDALQALDSYRNR